MTFFCHTVPHSGSWQFRDSLNQKLHLCCFIQKLYVSWSSINVVSPFLNPFISWASTTRCDNESHNVITPCVGKKYSFLLFLKIWLYNSHIVRITEHFFYVHLVNFLYDLITYQRQYGNDSIKLKGDSWQNIIFI